MSTISPTTTNSARASTSGVPHRTLSDVVETSVPAYAWRGFRDHQLRWLSTVRDARPRGYAGLVFTQGFTLAVLNIIASGLSPLSLWLLAMSFFLRLTLAMTVGAEVLGDHQVLPTLWLLPLRDLVATGLWVAGFAGHTIIWRGERRRGCSSLISSPDQHRVVMIGILTPDR